MTVVNHLYVTFPKNTRIRAENILVTIGTQLKIVVSGRRVVRKSFGRFSLLPALDHRYDESGAYKMDAFEKMDKAILKINPKVNYVISIAGADEEDADKKGARVIDFLKKNGIDVLKY